MSTESNNNFHAVNSSNASDYNHTWALVKTKASPIVHLRSATFRMDCKQVFWHFSWLRCEYFIVGAGKFFCLSSNRLYLLSLKFIKCFWLQSFFLFAIFSMILTWMYWKRNQINHRYHHIWVNTCVPDNDFDRHLTLNYAYHSHCLGTCVYGLACLPLMDSL